ncbi:unnamed protein product, partial [Mesorhabditis spiculigera]
MSLMDVVQHYSRVFTWSSFLKMLLHTIVASCFATMIPLFLRWMYLPTSVDHKLPLNMAFKTCTGDLHGVCSFPTATRRYPPDTIFAEGVTYDLMLELHFDGQTADFSEFFQVAVRFQDSDGTNLHEYTKIVYPFKPRGIFSKVFKLFFYPLYFVGMFDDSRTAHVPITSGHAELDELSSQFVVEVQNRAIVLEFANLYVSANFGLIPRMMYSWPISSYLALYLICFGLYFTNIAFFHGLGLLFSSPEGTAKRRPEQRLEDDALGTEAEHMKARIRRNSEMIEERTKGRAGIRGLRKMNTFNGDIMIVRAISFWVILSTGCANQICPGFCGKVILERHDNGTNILSECQACPWGSRVQMSFTDTGRVTTCEPCTEELPLYDWLFLLFVALVPTITNSFFVRYYALSTSQHKNEFLEHFCCLLESFVAACAALLVMEPRGSLRLYSCSKSLLREWYPALHNPQIFFGRKLHCSYELVYPLYSLPFVYLLFCLITLLVFRTILYSTIRRKDRSRRAYYAALYAIPLIALGHALLAGLLYYLFAYVLMLWSMASNAVHLALEGNKPMRVLFNDLLRCGKHLTFLIVNMCLLAFAIVTIAVERADGWSLLLIALIPMPASFYLLTSSLSHPSALALT